MIYRNTSLCMRIYILVDIWRQTTTTTPYKHVYCLLLHSLSIITKLSNNACVSFTWLCYFVMLNKNCFSTSTQYLCVCMCVYQVHGCLVFVFFITNSMVYLILYIKLLIYMLYIKLFITCLGERKI